MNGAISTLPIIVKDELQNFITQFTESLHNQEPSKIAEAIRELTGVLEDLKTRLVRLELIHADMTAKVDIAMDEIRLHLQNLPSQDNAAPAGDTGPSGLVRVVSLEKSNHSPLTLM